MSAQRVEDLKKLVVEQGDLVRKLKNDKADEKKINTAVEELKRRKADLEAAQKLIDDVKQREADRRNNFDTLLTRKFFVVPAFEIYGGVRGLYDFGPPGCALMNNLIQLWRQHFVLHEDMLEVSTTSMTPEIVLKTSGHVDKFADFMVRDLKNGNCHRADKILEDALDKLIEAEADAKKRHELEKARLQAGAYTEKQLGEALKLYKVTAPDTGNELSEPFPFNLMFGTSIGPTGKQPGFLRPETAQGIFVNFRRLLEFNSGKMPFAAAQIGPAFRNEIAPRAGLLRVREFTLAEIEHFVNPHDKRHPRFVDIRDLKLQLFPREQQEEAKPTVHMSLGDAVEQKVINNETLAYFMGRTHLFLTMVGIQPAKLRFRQHKRDEMAHYAQDCWDAEIFTTYGWVECVGHADRAAFDLTMHAKESGVELVAQETYAEPKKIEKISFDFDYKKFSQVAGKATQVVTAALNDLKCNEAEAFHTKLQSGPQEFSCSAGTFTITPDMIKKMKRSTELIHVQKFVPNVIEPSFGLGRILYAILEHSFDDQAYESEQRSVLHLPPCIAATKVGICPLLSKDSLNQLASKLSREFVHLNVPSKIDDSGVAIGRKYARADEIGTPYCVTIDMETLEDQCVTVRDRDTTKQIRVPFNQVAQAVANLVSGRLLWSEAQQRFPEFLRPEDGESKGEKSDAPDFGDLKSAKGLKALNNHLANKSYIKGFQFSRVDADLCTQVPLNIDDSEYPHVARWAKHVRAQI